VVAILTKLLLNSTQGVRSEHWQISVRYPTFLPDIPGPDVGQALPGPDIPDLILMLKYLW